MSEDVFMLQLPFPDKVLNPNQSMGRSWRVTASQRAAAKELGYFLARQAMETQTLAPATAYELTVDIYPPDLKHRDTDNLLSSIKHQLDGMCLALEIDDKLFRRTILNMQEPIKDGGIDIEIRLLVWKYSAYTKTRTGA